MAKFIIINRSLCDLQEYHYECSISVAEAATRAGYQPIIIANRVLPQSIISEGIQIIPVFEVDWFNNPVEKTIETTPTKKLSIKNKQSFRWGWNYQRDRWETQYPQWSFFFEKVEGSTQRLSEWVKDDLQLLRAIPLSNTLWGLFKIVWGLIRFIVKLGIQNINKVIGKIKPSRQASVKTTQRFTETLDQILPTLHLTSQDQVFIHTLGIEQLEELYHYLQIFSPESLPIYHILLRRDPDEPLITNAQGMGLKRCLQAFYDSKIWPEKIRFYTDSDDLVKKHNVLSPVIFNQIPIPFRQEKLEVIPPTLDDFIHIVYLGDARAEKGYQYLPGLVQVLWDDYLQQDKVRLTIQSNYNVQNGEQGILEAKLNLAQYPSPKVRLIDEAMSPDEYYQLLVSADLVVLPYNPQNYQRTSGVLTEALAAGKPVVVPAKSWLAEQVDESRARIYKDPQQFSHAVIEAIENIESLAIAAKKYSYEWKIKQSPDRLLEILLSPLPVEIYEFSTISKKEELPGILITVSAQSFLLSKSNFDGKILRCFCQNGYRVYALVYGISDLSSVESQEDLALILKTQLKDLGLTDFWLLSEGISNYENCNNRIGASWVQDWQTQQEITLPEALSVLIQSKNLDLIWLDNILVYPWVNQSNLPIIAEIKHLEAYYYAKVNQRELDPQELVKEIQTLQRCHTLVTRSPILAAKLEELTKEIPVYSLQQKELLNDLIYEQIQSFYGQQIQRVLGRILGDRLLPLTDWQHNQKIALLYPWNDIQERRSGASQRTGLLLDYLREQSYETRLYTIGSQRSLWSDGVYYEYYEPYFEQAELVTQVYQDAYRSWDQDFKLIGKNLEGQNLGDDFVAVEQHWLPWIYYQFRFDPGFQAWLEKITDWADVVILEYPFWGTLVGEMCRRKKVRFLLTAHDVLAKNLSLETSLGQIALGEELQSLKQADAVITVSPKDQTFFAHYGITNYCVPTAIDTQKIEQYEAFRDRNPLTSILRCPVSEIKSLCLFVGSQHPPNIEAVKQIRRWSQMSSGNVDFVVVGGCWEAERQENFMALGKVPESHLIHLYQQATLVLAPLTVGTGISVKIIEAMAYGKGILGTTLAFRGYPILSGENVMICDSLDNYPIQIEQLLQQPDLLARIGQQAKQFAQAYDYRQLYKTYVDLMG